MADGHFVGKLSGCYAPTFRGWRSASKRLASKVDKRLEFQHLHRTLAFSGVESRVSYVNSEEAFHQASANIRFIADGYRHSVSDS
jgi:hypothetical protein